MQLKLQNPLGPYSGGSSRIDEAGKRNKNGYMFPALLIYVL